MKTHLTILFTFFLVVLFSQSEKEKFSLYDTQFIEGSILVIEALEYTNDINKYYFNKSKMDSLAAVLIEFPGLKIEIVCNDELSEAPFLSMMATSDQASGIRTYLVNKGVKGNQIEIYGNGDMNLIYSENDMIYMDSAGKFIANKSNRRIEVNVIAYVPTTKKKSSGLQMYPR